MSPKYATRPFGFFPKLKGQAVGWHADSFGLARFDEEKENPYNRFRFDSSGDPGAFGKELASAGFGYRETSSNRPE